MMRNVVCGALFILAGICISTSSYGAPLPGGQNSDVIGWQVFSQVVAPSGDPDKKRVEFETWASDQDIYQNSPPIWPAAGQQKHLKTSSLALAAVHSGVKIEALPPGSTCTPPEPGIATAPFAAKGSNFPTTACVGEEVRRNWASFQYIASNGLYSVAGLSAAFDKGLKVSLPADAIEFKGDWVEVAVVAAWLKIDPKVVREHYYTSVADFNGKQTEVALMSFHFSTKQTADWVWSDFEGELNLGRCDVIGCHDTYGATTPNVAPNPTAWETYNLCPKKAELVDLLKAAGDDPIWSHYCMKGTQIGFGDQKKPTLLGNSIIEPLNADVPMGNSSCITCHAYASFGKGGTINFAGLTGTPPTGPVDQSKLTGYTTNDFIYGIVTGIQAK